MNKTELSIIIPVHNQEKFLAMCLESLINQDIDEYEVILIDDASVDSSKKICEEFIQKYKIFKYIYQENQGPGPARNTGLDCAQGNYIMFVDSDDVIRENCVGKLLSHMKCNELDMMYFDEIVCTQDMVNDRVQAVFPYMQQNISKVEALEYCMQPAHVCARLYRRELFDKIRFEKMWYEDMEIFPRLILAAEKIGYYKMPIYYYRKNTTSITHSDNDNRSLDVLKAWDNVMKLPNLTDDEAKALEKTVMRSVADFVFFKKNYAKKYIDWYNSIRKCNMTVKKMVPEIMKDEFCSEYPLYHQADMCREESLKENLEKMLQAFYKGGDIYFAGFSENDYHFSNECLVLNNKDEISLGALRIEPQSEIMYRINKEIRCQNLISLRGEKKEFLLEKIVLKYFMEYGYPIEVVE